MKKSIYAIWIGIGFLISSCAHVPNEPSPSIFDNTPGVVGDADFKLGPPPAHIAPVWRASVILVADGLDGKFRSLANGFHFKNKCDAHEYVITAKHVVYDPKTGKKVVSRLGAGTPVSENEEGDARALDIANLPETVAPFAVADDILAIKVLRAVNNTPTVTFNPETGKIYSFTEDISKEDIQERKENHALIPSYFNTSILASPKDEFGARSYQDNIKLKFAMDEHKNLIYLAALDTIKGMSGSPIFLKNGADGIYLMGTISKARTAPNAPKCGNFDDMACWAQLAVFLPSSCENFPALAKD